MVTIALLLAALPAPMQLIDDFEAPETDWTSKPTAALSIEGDPGERALRVDLDLTAAPYAWFRKTYADTPVDASGWDGLRFRVKGGARDARLLLHVMTGSQDPPTGTFVCQHLPGLGCADWQTVEVAWVELRGQQDGRRVTPDDLSHVEAVNISVTGVPGEKMTLCVDDVEFADLPDDVVARKQRLAGPPRIETDAEFFAALDFDAYPGLAPVRDALPDLSAAKSALLEYMRGRTDPRYFFDPADPQALPEAMQEGQPSYSDSTVRSARVLLTHQYSWEGETRELPRPIDYTASDAQWYAVLTRFGFLRTVLEGYWYTGEEQFAEEVVGQMCEFARSAPIPDRRRSGMAWVPLQAGVRAHTWLGLYLGALHSPAMTPEANFIILKSLAEHARFLADPSLNGGLPNMVIVESTGLVELALVLPEFADAALWRERGFEVLEAEMTRRVLPDGAWEEATPGYHGWVAHSCCELAALTKLNGVDLPDSVLSRFRAMYNWLLLISKPNGHSPMLGDANDGSIAGRMAEAALQFEAPDYRWFGPGTPPVALLSWYGADTMQRYTALAKREPQARSTLLPDSGLAVMRTGWHSHDSYLLFDFGPIWSHTHQDTLGFSLHALGQTLLWDSGVSNYDMPECFGYYRQARAHNVVLIDDADMKLGPERPRLLAWKTTPAYDLVDAEAVFAEPAVTHRRAILFIKPGTWVIRDLITSDDPHRLTRLFHVREKAQVEKTPSSTAAGGEPAADRSSASVRVSEPGGPVLTIHGVRPADAELTVGEGLLTYAHGRGPGSNNLPAPVVRFSSQASTGATDLLTVISVCAADAPGPDVSLNGPDRLTISTNEGGVAVGLPAPSRTSPILSAPVEPTSSQALGQPPVGELLRGYGCFARNGCVALCHGPSPCFLNCTRLAPEELDRSGE